jgi:alpha-aminoadipate carrier protein LysW
MVNCPLCYAAIDVDEEELDEGDALVCEECGASLNVSSVSPLELAADADEDLEDDEEFDDDFDDEDEDEEEEDDEED